MDISLREWLIILGVLIIIVVVLDGIRRARRARLESMEISQGMGGNFESTPLDDDFNPELPSAGFRVVRKGMDSRHESDYPEYRESDYPEYKEAGNQDEHSNAPEYISSQDTESDDSLYDQVAYEERDGSQVEQFDRVAAAETDAGDYERFDSEPSLDSYNDAERYDSEPMRAEPRWDDGNPVADTSEDPISAVEDMVQADLKSSQLQAEVADKPDKSQEKVSDFKDRFLKKITANVDAIQESLQQKQHRHHKPVYKSAKQKRLSEKAAKSRDVQEEIIVVNVLAKTPEGFEGMKLRHLVEACGLQLGDMSIYHRHEYDFDQGPVQFSMANAVKPGTFGRDMDNSMTPGVSFFMRLPGPDDSMQAFDYMIETAQCLVRNLGGELKDEYLSVMTSQTVEHCRQRVREFERKQQLSSKV